MTSQRPLLDEKYEKVDDGDPAAWICRQFHNLPSSFQMPTILKIITRLHGFPSELTVLRKRVKQRLRAFTYVDRYAQTVSEKVVPPHVLKTTMDFCNLGREYTVPTIINLLCCLSEMDLKEILETIDGPQSCQCSQCCIS